MTDKDKVEETTKTNEVTTFIKELREFALTVGEDCPEGHRRDPGSGRCLPIGSLDHTSFTRSKNVDDGPAWRGTAEEGNVSEDGQETAVDATDMDEPESCAEGTTFSFIQRRCIPLEEADAEDNDEFAMSEEGEYIVAEEAAAPGSGGHMEITEMQPEGRRDTVNHDCPADQIFDYVLRKCIPLNKDSLMASEMFDEEFKKELALWANVAVTTPDPIDGHKHVATLDGDGNGTTSMANMYYEGSHPHSHGVKKFVVSDHAGEEYTSKHPGFAIPVEHEIRPPFVDGPATVTSGSEEKVETAAPITTKQRKALPTSSFGVPRTRGFPLDSCNRVRNAMARFNQAKGLSSGEKATLKRKILAAAKKCGIKVGAFAKANADEEYAAVAKAVMVGLEFEITENGQLVEDAAKITTKQRKALPSSSFGVPGKRKFPLDTCARVRNAMARFNQAKGLTSSEKATLRRKILARAKTCGIEVRNFGKANTVEEFAAVTQELVRMETGQRNRERLELYRADADTQGPCPPGMKWDAGSKRCGHMRGFVQELSRQPEGRRDPVGFGCPDGEFYDYTRRRCLPLDPSRKMGTTTTQAEEEDAQSRVLSPNPSGKPAKLPQDCPKGTIWDKDKEDCIPLDSRQKTKSAEEAQKKDNDMKKQQTKKDCGPDEFFNPVLKKCMPKKGAFKKMKSGEETADLDKFSIAQLIQQLDMIIKESGAGHTAERAKVAAKDLPNAAFPPSLVSPVRRSLMHHVPTVEDPYDHASVDIGRLRNALFRVTSVEDFSEKAVEDAQEHLLFHAREIVNQYVGKKE